MRFGNVKVICFVRFRVGVGIDLGLKFVVRFFLVYVLFGGVVRGVGVGMFDFGGRGVFFVFFRYGCWWR